ncbi:MULTISPECIES: CHAP domain-containing protein [Pseudanabaena]|uniref:CHAP domain containing protein n=2 Tax=Pseudanabaena TaxID=1152 RepID=L8N3V5_9CYAN|nr:MULTISPECIES: CHAP domain-containing protein [Pseudanabaena]ELS33400.1 CHAP domain containing protein [Pseudanabaena biceps PCC 7429]MDG3494381.1 CHAP domain-containing protein [Pseudanabaena catenata USMAC16]
MPRLTGKFVTSIAVVATLVGINLLSFSSPASSQSKASWCWCTDYVANKFNLKNFPAANRWNDGFLQKNGFTQTQSPKSGDIVVMEAGFPWADTTYGHVALFESLNSKGFVSVRGANNGGKIASTDAKCNNVTSLLYNGKGAEVSKNNSKISFWTNRR